MLLGRQQAISIDAVEVRAERTLTAIFDDNKVVQGFAGCGTYNGPYKLSGSNGISMGPLAPTTRGCGLDDEQTKFLNSLIGTTTYTLSGTDLTFNAASGIVAATFKHQ